MSTKTGELHLLPVLTNGRRNFSARHNRPMYCAAIRAAIGALSLYPPQLRGAMPPGGDSLHWPNFPARDCFGIVNMQDLYTFFEDRWPDRLRRPPRP